MINTWATFVLLNHAVEKTPEYAFFFTYIKISLNLKGRKLAGLESKYLLSFIDRNELPSKIKCSYPFTSILRGKKFSLALSSTTYTWCKVLRKSVYGVGLLCLVIFNFLTVFLLFYKCFLCMCVSVGLVPAEVEGG